MFCRNCGKEVADQAVMCIACGVPPKSGNKFCQNCAAATSPAASMCIKCGVALAKGAPQDAVKSKIAAGLLGIFLGAWGIHRFYLGYVGIGILQIVVTICTCGLGGLWGFIEGICVLAGSINKDAQGRPLKD